MCDVCGDKEVARSKYGKRICQLCWQAIETVERINLEKEQEDDRRRKELTTD